MSCSGIVVPGPYLRCALGRDSQVGQAGRAFFQRCLRALTGTPDGLCPVAARVVVLDAGFLLDRGHSKRVEEVQLVVLGTEGPMDIHHFYSTAK